MLTNTYLDKRGSDMVNLLVFYILRKSPYCERDSSSRKIYKLYFIGCQLHFTTWNVQL
jgi:hypothetical protein